MNRKALILSAALVAVALLTLSPASGEEESVPATGEATPTTPRDITQGQIDAVAEALAWLAEKQHSDGSFNEETQSNIAVTSLALLAFMANGNTEVRGRYSEQVRSGIAFLLRQVTTPDRATAKIPTGYIHMEGDEQSRMHGHGYATQVLALAYGMEDRRSGAGDELRRKLTHAVTVIERSQDDSGGWGYHPRNQMHEGSVTVCQVQALRAAREAGIPVNRHTIDRAVHYLVKSRDAETGGFSYSLNRRDQQTFALTAAALSTLFGLAEYARSDMISAGLDYLSRRARDHLGGHLGWFHYGSYYAAQAMWQAGGDERYGHHWSRWWPPIRDQLVRDAGLRGYWNYTGGSSTFGVSDVYATSMSLLILQVPLEILPSFQR